jgi:hypothetical protein
MYDERKRKTDRQTDRQTNREKGRKISMIKGKGGS